jgi:hypothetical protein
MSPDKPIGLCCSRPRLNAVGGIDERAWPYEFLSMLGRLRRIPQQGESGADKAIRSVRPQTR